MKINHLFLFLFLSIPACNSSFIFNCSKITDKLIDRMYHTWRNDSPVALEDLRYIIVSHYDFDGNIKKGELIVHYKVVEDLEYILKKLFEAQFPITSMRFVDEFNGSDDESMKANNSSAFFARKVAGTSRWSNHSYGCAIDINPLLNPYTKEKACYPPEGRIYLKNRSHQTLGIITSNSNIYKLFKERGWEWGGECFLERDGVEDLHHFQKIIPGINKNTN